MKVQENSLIAKLNDYQRNGYDQSWLNMIIIQKLNNTKSGVHQDMHGYDYCPSLESRLSIRMDAVSDSFLDGVKP